MSLLRLLTSGRSLVGLQNATSRYRMRSRFLLPRFGRIEDPFTAPDTAGPVSVPASSQSKIEKYQMSPAELAAARLKETKKIPLAPATPAATPPRSRPGAVAGLRTQLMSWIGSVPWMSWWQALNPLAWWQRRREVRRMPVSAAASRAPVQGELSLDRVKVMRNDLSDADMEIVPVKPAVKTPAAKTPAPAAPAAPSVRPKAREEVEALNTD